jgi:hypothetical protein
VTGPVACVASASAATCSDITGLIQVNFLMDLLPLYLALCLFFISLLFGLFPSCSGEKPHTCPFAGCLVSFARRGPLEHHLQMQHPDHEFCHFYSGPLEADLRDTKKKPRIYRKPIVKPTSLQRVEPLSDLPFYSVEELARCDGTDLLLVPNSNDAVDVMKWVSGQHSTREGLCMLDGKYGWMDACKLKSALDM